jgi:Mg2+-importing ATPase
VIATSLVIAAIGISIPFTALRAALDFVALPATYYSYLLLILLSCAALTHIVKTWCTRRSGLS